MAHRQEDIGNRIRETRRALGLSQLELAGDDLSASYVSLLESGKRSATKHVVDILAARLETSAEYLLEGIDVRARDGQELRLRYAELALQNGEGDEALTHFRQLVAETDPDSAVHREASWGACRALEASGRIEEAIEAYDRVRMAALNDPDHHPRWAEAIIALCRCSGEVGDLSRAIELGEEALRHLGELGLQLSDLQVQIVSTLVGSYYYRGDLVRAQILATQLIDAVEGMASPLARGAAYWNASLVAESRGRLGEAINLAEKAVAMYSEASNQRSYARVKVAYAWLLLRQAEPALARSTALLTQARAELSESGGTLAVAYCDTELARCELLAGRSAEAIVIAQRVVEQIGEGRIEAGRAMLVIGQALCEQGNLGDGRAQVAHAAQILQGAGGGREAATAWREAGDVLSQLGEHMAATDAYQRALGLLGVSAAPTPAGLRSLVES